MNPDVGGLQESTAARATILPERGATATPQWSDETPSTERKGRPADFILHDVERQQAFCHTNSWLSRYRPWIRQRRHLSSGYRALGAFALASEWDGESSSSDGAATMI